MSYKGFDGLSADGSSVESASETLSMDEIFGLLSNSRRRAALLTVLEHDNLEFGELVDEVAAEEYGLTPDEISGDERHRVYVSLRQSHMETLKEAGVVDYDRVSGRIKRGPNAQLVAEYMGRADLRPSWTDRIKQSFAALAD